MDQSLQERESMSALTINTSAIAPAWQAFQGTLPFRIAPIINDEQYDQVVLLMNGLIDVVGDDEHHELADFLYLVGQLVEDYENTHVTIPDAAPSAVLRFLMDQHELTQADLAAELGGQPVVSAILSGRREINVRQARALATRFNVSPAVFL
jgi:HTH-type transcriptional regulator/antitoxin HigA